MDSVLEPLPSLENEAHYKIATSIFGSHGLLELFGAKEHPHSDGYLPRPVFPGELVLGHVEFTPNCNLTIASTKLFVEGSVGYKEEVETKGMVRDTITTHSWNTKIFFDDFDVTVSQPSLLKGIKSVWPFSFVLNRKAIPYCGSGLFSSPFSTTKIAVLIYVHGKAQEPILSEDTCIFILLPFCNGYACTAHGTEFIVGSSPFPDPAIVTGQNLESRNKRGSAGSFFLGKSMRNDDDRFFVKVHDWKKPYSIRKSGVAISSGNCCKTLGLADVAMTLEHRIIYVAPSNGSTVATLRGTWGRQYGNGNPVVVRMAGSLGIVTHTIVLTAANMKLTLIGSVLRKNAPTHITDDTEPHDETDVCKFSVSEPNFDGELILQPIDLSGAEASDGITSPSFISEHLAVNYRLELVNGWFNEEILLKVPVVRNQFVSVSVATEYLY